MSQLRKFQFNHNILLINFKLLFFTALLIATKKELDNEIKNIR
jgi:hypothetical protein